MLNIHNQFLKNLLKILFHLILCSNVNSKFVKAELFNFNFYNEQSCTNWIGDKEKLWRRCEVIKSNYDSTKVEKCSFIENKYFDDNKEQYQLEKSDEKCREVTNTFEDIYNKPQINIEISPELLN